MKKKYIIVSIVLVFIIAIVSIFLFIKKDKFIYEEKNKVYEKNYFVEYSIDGKARSD